MRELTFAQALNEGLRQEMRRDQRIFVMGENVSSDWREATRGLMREFGRERVRDTPITESAFVGAGVGAAIAGMRPVVEMMLVDFALVAMDQILNQAAKTRYMLGGRVRIPITMRAIFGAGTSSGSTHSETLYSLFAHMPGLKVVVPSTPYDAKGLLISSVRDDDPKVFFEHRLLYQTRGPVPEEAYAIPLGEADVKRRGRDVTVVAAGLMVPRALEAAERLGEEGISVEVVDPRTVVPLDRETILSSVEKTGRLVVVDEDYERCGFTAEVVAVVADEGFDHLSAPIKRVATPNVPIPYNPRLESYVIPGVERIVQTARGLVAT
ncbi:MAG: alpha-ketoacid dehydrogenase subunit beta [Candidatus Bathyarchaeia archaeon]